MLKYIARFLFKITGWKIDPNPPENIKKCVVAVGPHTSNWDFIIGKLAFVMYGVNAKFLIKKELFFPPFGWFLKWAGGIPVNRKKNNQFSSKAISLFDKEESLYLVFTPEGTRKYNSKWKKGFYYIALKAKVPIYICYIDFSKKRGGFDSVFHPSGDVDKDILEIKSVLKKYKGRFPENGID